MSSSKPVIPVISVQVQTSFQAVPLGAACVVSALRADPRVASRAEVRLFDFSMEDILLAGKTPEEAGKIIAGKVAESFSGICAGFSVYVWNRPILEAAARELRKLFPSVCLFAGGPEITAAPDTNAFDQVILGEGESASCELVASLLDGRPVPPSITGKKRSTLEDCSRLSSPWLDRTLDDSPSVRTGRGALWELARGCPYSCSYCYESKGEKKVRTFPLARLEKELEYFKQAGIERVFVLDPTYNASRERALSLLKLIEKKTPEIHFNFEVRAELLDRELVEAFSRIPCSLQIGLQSSNPEALRLVNRPVDFKQFVKKIALLNEAGVVFGLDLMYGLPGDTLSTFHASIDYALELYPNNMEVFRLAVLPGTALADHAADFGLDYQKTPPYHICSTPKFPAADLERAARIARACDIFYTQGRAVTWFLSVLHVLKLKPSQLFQDFADYIELPAVRKSYPELGDGKKACDAELPQARAEALLLDFLKKKFADKSKAYLLPALTDIVHLNGAWTRALAENEDTELELSYDPDDVLSSDAMDIEYFSENVYMEKCRVRVFCTADGPDFKIV